VAQGRGEHNQTTIKTFEGDDFGINAHQLFLIPAASCGGIQICLTGFEACANFLPVYIHAVTKASDDSRAKTPRTQRNLEIPAFPLSQREAVKKLVLLNPTPKISPDPLLSKIDFSTSQAD
jgi:hypothetical protein